MAEQLQTPSNATQVTEVTGLRSPAVSNEERAQATTSEPANVIVGVENSTSTTEGLPPGWQELVDSEGRTYYVDHDSKTTSFQRPEARTDVARFAMRKTATHISLRFTAYGSFDGWIL
ncbi:WW domain containing E3 ubiquitin protein ligase 1 [Elasticomyces elasticus]|nr:WW domain containing E3 ubiquitin protein ligase 1 [Elasticomyces elasticus]KAK3657261.1 WW domain containing E3 ubiquitin protein ligase 1 [Elasticomyces elasticus]KAK4922192.1 WW domain containing E3 ubiquitin protein ligase 1 [Elasticomyces elasticus]KAK5760869.1 WW domain containing E3 ubiquitin protein ligase 1 [Elasticomyces elasticus]